MSSRATTTRTTLAAAAAALATLAAGCSSLSNSGGAPSGLTTTGNPPSSTTTRPSTTREPTRQTPSAAATDTGGGTASGPEKCLTGNLKITVGRGDSGAGHHYVPLRFTNTGPGACTIVAWPGVSYVAGDNGHQVGKAASRVGPRGTPITLQPGDVAHAEVDEVNVRNYDASVCHLTEVRGLRVYPPHNTASAFVPLQEAYGCANKDMSGDQLRVKAVAPGPGGR